MEKKYLTLIKEDNSTVEAEILFTYHSEEFKKDYVVFLPEDTNEVAAASYVENGDGGSLDCIENEDEWQLIEDLLEDYVNSHEELGYECNCESCEGCEDSCDGGCSKEDN